MKSSKTYSPLVKCPFCGKQVESKKLADHAKYSHAPASQNASKKVKTVNTLLDGVEVQDSSLLHDIKQHFIDESGVLINPNLLEEEHHKSRDERLGTVSLRKHVGTRRNKKTKTAKPEIKPSKNNSNLQKSIDDIYHEKDEWLRKVVHHDKVSNAVAKLSKAIESATTSTQPGFAHCPVCKSPVKQKNLWKHFASAHSYIKLTNEQIYYLENGNINDIHVEKVKGPRKFKLTIKHGKSDHQISPFADFDEAQYHVDLVKCPLCKHKTKYKVLFVHIQVSHPEVNPKIVMSKFNKVNRNKDYGNSSKYQDELNELVKDYERLKQGQDEPRDGGKYMGHMRREHGKFGSLPLYDDYSDEADAE